MSAVLRSEPVVRSKPISIVVSVARVHPDDDSVIVWTKTSMTRPEAAVTLRAARRRGDRIEPSATGYSISPSWWL